MVQQQQIDVTKLISREEDERSEFLMKQLQYHQRREDEIKKELRKIIYKLDRKI